MEQLNLFDLLVFIIIIISVFYGYRKGLVYQLGSVASLFISGLVAFTFMPGVSTALPIQNEHLRNTVAFLGILAVCSIVIWQLVNLISSAIQQMELTSWNYQMGGVAGFFQGILWSMICGFILAIVSSQTHDIVAKSITGYPLLKTLNEVVEILPLPASHKEIIQKYTRKWEEGGQYLDSAIEISNPLTTLNANSNEGGGNVNNTDSNYNPPISGYQNAPTSVPQQQTYADPRNNAASKPILPAPPQNQNPPATYPNYGYPNNQGNTGQGYGNNTGYNNNPGYSNPGYGNNTGYNNNNTGYNNAPTYGPNYNSANSGYNNQNYRPQGYNNNTGYNQNNYPNNNQNYNNDQGIPPGNYNGSTNQNPW